MAEEDIRRYSIEELREKNKRGAFKPAPVDAPTIDLDEEFWTQLEGARPLPAGSEVVELVLPQSTVEGFAQGNADYQTEMARVLDAYAASRAKKAS